MRRSLLFSVVSPLAVAGTLLVAGLAEAQECSRFGHLYSSGGAETAPMSRVEPDAMLKAQPPALTITIKASKALSASR